MVYAAARKSFIKRRQYLRVVALANSICQEVQQRFVHRNAQFRWDANPTLWGPIQRKLLATRFTAITTS